jgi:5-methyltetrahydrofolate corrinoid/iron sulfur protein methyltransferase
MAIVAGLDAAIMDPLDKDLMDAMITAELLLEKVIYCDSFLDAYRMANRAAAVA